MQQQQQQQQQCEQYHLIGAQPSVLSSSPYHHTTTNTIPSTTTTPVAQPQQQQSSSSSFRWNAESYTSTVSMARVENNKKKNNSNSSGSGIVKKSEDGVKLQQEYSKIRKKKKKHLREEGISKTSKNDKESTRHHHHRHHHRHHREHKRHTSSSSSIGKEVDGIKKSKKVINVNNRNNAIPLKRRCPEGTVPSLSELVANHNKSTTPATTRPINNISPTSTKTISHNKRTPLPPPPLRSSYNHHHQQQRQEAFKKACNGSGSGDGGITTNGFAPKYVPKGEHADKRSKTIDHTNECPVKHKWVNNNNNSTQHDINGVGGGGVGGGGYCPVCNALLEPHAIRAKENNLRLLTTAVDVSPDTKTITLRYGCRYGHKFTQQQDVSAPYDRPLSCPQCRLAKAPSSSSFRSYRNNNANARGGGGWIGGCIDPMSGNGGMSARDRQAAALKAARMEYEASIHKGGVTPATIENNAKINKLVSKLKSEVANTREQVVLGIVECPDDVGLWPLLRTLLDLHQQQQPGAQTAGGEVDKDRLYRRAALLCHPDKCNHDRAKEAFTKLSAEYALSNK